MEPPGFPGRFKSVEYVWGGKFDEHSVVVTRSANGYAFTTHLYSPLLLLARVSFTDGAAPLILTRYINLETSDGTPATAVVAQRHEAPNYVVEARVRSGEVFVAITNVGPKANFGAQVVQIRDVSMTLLVPWRVQWVGGDFNKRPLDSDEMQELILGTVILEPDRTGLSGAPAARPYFYFLTPSGSMEAIGLDTPPLKFHLRLSIRCDDNLTDYVVWINVWSAPTGFPPNAAVVARSARWEDR
jgi:hypothetical protein